ncbi:MAG: YCF48-related protein, partial [Bacteroidales bacterium]|nr:YCF48-related protein [Bacteroidales bacterium]
SGTGRTYKSVDGGETWNVDTSGMNLAETVNRIELAVTPNNPNVVYALASNSADDGFYALYKSTNSGDTWTSIYDGELNLLGWSSKGTDSGGQGWYDLALAVSPSDENVILVGGVNVWKSIDGGATWDLSAHWTHKDWVDYAHADHHFFAYSPVDSSLYSANDGGLFVSLDDGENWESISNGLEISQFYKLGTSSTLPNTIIVGAQDNGTLLYADDEWNAVIGGDGMECLIDYSASNIMYGELYNGEIRKSFDSGNNFDAIYPIETPSGAWVTPFAIHPEDPQTLLIGYQALYKTTNGGMHWDTLVADLSTVVDELNYTFRTIVFSIYNPNFIYVASRRNIWKSEDAGQTWSNITLGLPSQNITSIATSPEDANKLWVTFSGYSSTKKVYHSEDGGANWSNFSDGLPNVPALSIVCRRNSGNELYVGTDIGVYRRTPVDNSWSSFNGNLPNVVIGELEINYSSNKLYAATYGRGVWTVELPTVAKINNSFSSDIGVIGCLDNNIEFYYTGNESFDSISWDVDDGMVISDKEDTIVVKFENLGVKTISMTHHLGGVSTLETKVNYVDIQDDIGFEVFPKSVSGCVGDSIPLKATGRFKYNWGSLEGLTSTDEKEAMLKIAKSGKIVVEAYHGACSAKDSINVYVTPDDVCNALFLPIGTHGPFNNFCATSQPSEPAPPGSQCSTQAHWCQSGLQNTLWFKVVVPDNNTISIAVPGMDNQIALYKANSCQDILSGNSNLLAANDDYPGLNDYSAIIEPVGGLTPGDTLWLQVDGSAGGALGYFSVIVSSSDLSTVDYTQRIPFTYSNVFPNPSQGIFNVELKSTELSNVVIEVFDIYGKLIEKREIKEMVSYINEEFDIQQSKGIHLVVINTKKERIYKKVLVK